MPTHFVSRFTRTSSPTSYIPPLKFGTLRNSVCGLAEEDVRTKSVRGHEDTGGKSWRSYTRIEALEVFKVRLCLFLTFRVSRVVAVFAFWSERALWRALGNWVFTNHLLMFVTFPSVRRSPLQGGGALCALATRRRTGRASRERRTLLSAQGTHQNFKDFGKCSGRNPGLGHTQLWTRKPDFAHQNVI